MVSGRKTRLKERVECSKIVLRSVSSRGRPEESGWESRMMMMTTKLMMKTLTRRMTSSKTRRSTWTHTAVSGTTRLSLEMF